MYSIGPGAREENIAYVEKTDVATHAINSGEFVIWKGDLYTANEDILIGTTLSLSNLTASSSGGLNTLNSHLGTLITTEEKTIIVGTNVTVSSRNGYYYGEYALSNFSDSTKIIAAQVVGWSGTVGTCIIDGANLCVLYNANPSNAHYLKVRAIKLNV